jgi:hypothetical protein
MASRPLPLEIAKAETTVLFEDPNIEGLRAANGDRRRLKLRFRSSAGEKRREFVLGRLPDDYTPRAQWPAVDFTSATQPPAVGFGAREHGSGPSSNGRLSASPPDPPRTHYKR